MVPGAHCVCVSPKSTQDGHVGGEERHAGCGGSKEGNPTWQHIGTPQASGQDAPWDLHEEEAVEEGGLQGQESALCR